MKRYKRDSVASKLKNGDEDEEKLYERQALISDEDEEVEREICDRNRVNRRRIKNEYEMKGISEPNIDYTFYDIQPGDSLQSICLRYTCPVTQVKRLNGLMTDQEFYGLRRLKLPLGKLGLLEDALMQKDLIQMHNNNNNSNNNNDNINNDNINNSNGLQTKFVNSPGSALSIRNSRFKPLLSPVHSSDNIRANNLLYNSHSFSSLRDFNHNNNNNDDDNDDKDVSIDLGTTISQLQNNHHNGTSHHQLNSNEMRQKTFIKSNISIDNGAQITIDALLTDTDLAQVPNVFEDLDYHVEKAKAAAEHYDKRAAELADRININNNDDDSVTTVNPINRVSKIPELFFSGENFGLNLTKLIALIFFICLVIPLVYMNQVNVIKKQL